MITYWRCFYIRSEFIDVTCTTRRILFSISNSIYSGRSANHCHLPKYCIDVTFSIRRILL